MRCCHFGFTATDHASFVVASLIEPEIIHYITVHTVHKSGSTLRSTLFGSILGRSRAERALLTTTNVRLEFFAVSAFT